MRLERYDLNQDVRDTDGDKSMEEGEVKDGVDGCNQIKENEDGK